MNVELNLIQTCGFQRTVPPVFSSSHTAVIASGNALVHVNLRTNERTIAVLADAPISALAGRSCAEYDDQDHGSEPVSIAYAEAGSTTIHLLGSLPQATPAGLCQQWESSDLGIVQLAFIPRPFDSNQQPQQQQRGKCSRLLLSINDLPNLTITIWDPDTRAALCSLQHALSSIPQWLSVYPPAQSAANNHPFVQMAAGADAGNLSNDAGAAPASPWASIRALLASPDEGAYTMTVNETFRGPQIVLTHVPNVVRINNFPGIDDTACPISGPPAWDQDGACAWAPVHGGHWITALDTIPGPHQRHELLASRPWAKDEPVHSVIAFHHLAPDVWAVVTGPGNVHWVRLSMSDVIGSDGPVLTVVASVEAPASSSKLPSSRSAAAEGVHDTTQDLVTAILSNSPESAPLHPYTFDHFAVASPNRDCLLIANEHEMWTVRTPTELIAPTPGLPSSPTASDLTSSAAEPMAKYMMSCSATRIVGTVAFSTISKALVIADDASATPMDLETDAFDPLGRNIQPCLAAPPELASLGNVTYAVGVRGTSMMLVGFATGVALVDWVVEQQLLQVIQIARTPRPVVKIGIEYTSRLFFVLLAPLPPTSDDPYASASRPITRGASPSPTKKSSSHANTQQSMDRAAILIHHLDTLMRYSYVAIDLPLALDANWDSVTDMSATIIVLARDRPPSQQQQQQQPAMSGLAQALANTSVMYVMSVTRDPVSDSRSTPNALAANSAASTGHQVTAASSVMVVRIPDIAYSLVLAPALPGAPTRLVCCLTADGTFKVYTISTNASSSTSSSSLTPAVVSPAHAKLGAKPQLLVVGPGAIMSIAGDGLIGVRTMRDLDHAARVLAHPGGVVDVAWTRRHLVSVGTDGLVRVWKWAVDDGDARMEDGWASAMRERVAQIRHQLQSKATADTSPDLISASTAVRTRLDTLTATLTKVLGENAAGPPNERLDFDDLVVNLTHAMQLAEQGMHQVAQARAHVLQVNAEREAEIERIKAQCWDPMKVPGKVLGGLANANLAVANYPVTRQDEGVVQRRRQVVLHRRMQMAIDDSASVNMRGGNGNGNGTLAESGSGGKDGPVDWSALLYPVAQLTTPERMRVQLVLLEACAETIRDQFNQRFDAVVKAKADTLAKVAEKNERIKGVLEELALLPTSTVASGIPVPPIVIATGLDGSAAPMATDLGEGEVPERILTVEDAELAGVPKYLSEEEEARAAEQRRLEAERAKNAGDDGRSRALNAMMGGVLVKDERANAIASAATIPKPDVLESNKPKADWTEDDKRLVKEYEKKVATVREEQEKARKALESELRKLEAAADELRQALDAKVLALLEDKMATDAQVHMAQLRALILAKRMDLAHHDEVMLAQLREREMHCQRQLAAAQAELPDIKQASEVQKEALDSLVKKDKELDKSYKKELTSGGGGQQQQQQPAGAGGQQSAVAAAMAAATASGGGGAAASGIPADTLWKLYKKRTVNAATGVADQGPLGEEDYIAGITPLQWSVLNDYRNRKMQVEAEIRGAMAKLKHTQRMAENLATRAESLRMDLESVHQSIDDLEEHMIAVRFDTMDLYTLKQGQVEVPPAPVVTDYSTAVLIHRAQVEELNDAIRRLGGTKLDALKEMRNYRRGILALDWETKVLEFQAGDVQLKTRDLQLLRVTKSMQEYLRSGDEGTLATMANTLERQLEYVTGSFAHKVAERDKVAKGLERQLRDKVKENTNLTKEVGKLTGLVDARARIHQLRAASAAAGTPGTANPSSGRTRLEPLRAGAAGAANKSANASGSLSSSGKHGGESDPRLAAIAQRRQLVDLARAQAQDIAVLSHEVQRWRLKTYPAFSSNSSAMGGASGTAASPSKEAVAVGHHHQQLQQQQRP